MAKPRAQQAPADQVKPARPMTADRQFQEAHARLTKGPKKATGETHEFDAAELQWFRDRGGKER